MMNKCITLLFLIMPLSLFADMKIVSNYETGAVMGQPPEKGTSTMYIKGNKARIDHSAKQTTIVDLDAKKIYMIDHSKKQIMEMDQDQMKQASGMIAQLGAAAKTTVDINKTGPARTINGFKCEDYQVSVNGPFSMKSTQCISSDVDIKEFDPFRPFIGESAKMIQGYDLSKLKGMPIQSKGTMSLLGQQIDTNTEVISISHDSIPDSTFNLPAGYTTREMPKMPGKP
jgi:hypothetical protein